MVAVLLWGINKKDNFFLQCHLDVNDQKKLEVLSVLTDLEGTFVNS